MIGRYRLFICFFIDGNMISPISVFQLVPEKTRVFPSKKAVNIVHDGFFLMNIGILSVRFLFLEKVFQRFACFHQLFRFFRRDQQVRKRVFRLGFQLVCDHSGTECHDSVL